ncbi:tail fiber protein [Thalassospira sp. A3_1]|uniref:phage tail protein n=1 Tax=Thalassospira sp. A3_1 TaxID=2821088 RepID=UPI001ADB549A|nr:tail fiber protein [Thalassospira sp. A3_1]MBO9507985.1 tail fiber protein [Thalassospira sp. A3_1]
MSDTITICYEADIDQFAPIAVPTASVLPFAGSTVPQGYLLCDGAEVSATDYANLFAQIGTTYGEASEEGLFKLPDLRGRVPVGAGLGDGLTDRVLGDAGGEEAHQLTVAEMPSHNHGGVTSTNGNHSHSTTSGTPHDGRLNAIPDQSFLRYMGGSSSTGAAGAHSHTISAQGGNQPHNNMQPFVVLNYIIKV